MFGSQSCQKKTAGFPFDSEVGVGVHRQRGEEMLQDLLPFHLPGVVSRVVMRRV